MPAREEYVGKYLLSCEVYKNGETAATRVENHEIQDA